MPFTIAIDGPAASGKGTIARALAQRFGFLHLDTGLLYRAVGAMGGDPVAAARALTPEDLLRPGEGGRAQERADLPPESAAGDEDEPLHALGEEVEELHRDPPTERVPDDGHPVDPEAIEQVAQGARVGAEGVVARRLVRLTVAEEVGHDDAVVVIQPVDQPAPLPLRAQDAVDEEHRRAGAAVHIGQLVPVQGHGARDHAFHECRSSRSGKPVTPR